MSGPRCLMSGMMMGKEKPNAAGSLAIWQQYPHVSAPVFRIGDVQTFSVVLQIVL